MQAVDHRRARFASFGSPDVLETEVAPTVEPGPGEVRIRVEASSVQFTDTLIRRGIYPDLKDKPPLTPGYDFVGTVDAVGEGVDAFAVGDRVADLTTIGSNAQFTVRPAAGLVPVPADVDAAAATTLVLSWLTAQQALFRVGQLQPGGRLLVVGGNGAVGQAAIALAKLHGAEVHATASERHHDLLRSLGANPLPREGGTCRVARDSAGGAGRGGCRHGGVLPSGRSGRNPRHDWGIGARQRAAVASPAGDDGPPDSVPHPRSSTGALLQHHRTKGAPPDGVS